ncbi:ECF RNA polymerase sigma factor SigH [Mycolicibacterium litorale]|uniref:RNA polymerase sigma factor n=1 Tax=Mycolicibacterium litorale TaxID=758802 RepID=A0A6S6P7N3_9MYCO|nr:sigma-70 family RNA polymerase sigma factor [Mycolicibacterium litorale]BCI55893.1 ECF RNA polymerase sigma factor SigH [Mycolicibacterium litorale]
MPITTPQDFAEATAPLLPELHQRALRLTRNHHDAEDLVQETMINAFRGYRSYTEGTNLRAWLYRIELNTFISEYRKGRRRPAHHLTPDFPDNEVTAAGQRGGAASRSAEDAALDRLPDGELRAAFQALPEQFRTAVYYADVAGYAFKEIAALTGAPLGTVMSRLHRGRTQLRTLMGAQSAA